MNNIVFQRARGGERQRWIRERLDETDATAIVFSASAGELANLPQPSCRIAHQVVRLGVQPDAARDSFNPLDVISYMAHLDLEAAVAILLEPVRLGTVGSPAPEQPTGLAGEPVWPALAVELLESLVCYQLRRKKSDASLIEALNYFYRDKTVYSLNLLLDHDAKLMEPNIHAALAGFIARTDLHRGAVLSIVQGAIACLNSAPAQRALARTSFDLGIVTGGRATVYVDIPPQLCASYGLVARLWLAAFLQLAAASGSSERPMLVVVDNAAELGMFPQLLAARQLPAGVRLWSLWDSLGQIRADRPADWSAFVGSCEEVLAVGPQASVVAAELAAAFEVPAAELRQLAPGGRKTLAGGAPNLLVAAAEPGTPGTVEGGHTLTFAPAQAARWAGVAEAILARRKGSIIVVESAGQCHALTAAGRAAVGAVVRLDPFGVLAEASDRFNPLGPNGAGTGVGIDSYRFVEQLAASGPQSIDPFWSHGSLGLIRAVLQYLAVVPEKPLTLGELWKFFHGEDVVYALAVVLDTIGKRLPADCYAEIAAFLQLADLSRSRILAEAARYLAGLGAEPAQAALAGMTFDPAAVAGGGATVYIEIPPTLWQSHGLLARLWLSALIELAASAAARTEATLVIVENAASLDLFELLLAAQRLPAGTVAVWSFWESLGQLKGKYPADWTAFIGSCGAVQALGPQSPVVAAELASVFGQPEIDLRSLAPGRRVTLAGETVRAAPPVAEPSTANSLGRGHVVTFATLHADPWGGVLAAMPGWHERPVVVVESAGRFHALAAAGRAAVGPVIRLDPFGVLNDTSHRFNPLDLFRVRGASAAADLPGLVELLYPPDPIIVDPYWRAATNQLIAGLLGYLVATPEKECSLVELRRMVGDDEALSKLAKIRASEAGGPSGEWLTLLDAFVARSENERLSIVGCAYHTLQVLGDPLAAGLVEQSDFDIRSFMSGMPITVCIELPTFKLPSFGLLVQLWVRSLLLASSAGKAGGRAVFVFENPFLRDLFPLLHRAQGLAFADLWTFWDSLDQLRSANPGEWSAFLANARRVEVVGPQGPLVAGELAQAFGCPRQAILALAPGESLVLQEYVG